MERTADEYRGIPDQAFQDATRLLGASPEAGQDFVETTALHPETKAALDELTRNMPSDNARVIGAYGLLGTAQFDTESVVV